MRISVLYFARVRELAGASEEVLAIEDGATIARALDVIVKRHPSIAPHVAQLRVARNEVFARTDEVVAEGDVLALIPPVAGG